MKIVIERQDAENIQFNPKKKYIVLNDFKNSNPIGVAKVFLEKGVMYAEIKLKSNSKGYPSIAYNKIGSEMTLYAIGICDNPNIDESIELIEYKTKS